MLKKIKNDKRNEATYQSRPLSDPLLACVALLGKIVDMRSKTNSSCCCVEVPFWLLGVFKLPSVHAPVVWCSPGLHIPVVPPFFFWAMSDFLELVVGHGQAYHTLLVIVLTFLMC